MYFRWFWAIPEVDRSSFDGAGRAKLSFPQRVTLRAL
jgi:hypothetical protein